MLTMVLYKYNKDNLTYEPIQIKTYILSAVIIFCIGMSIGVSPRMVRIVERIPVIIQESEDTPMNPDRIRGFIREMNFKYPDIVYAQAVLETGNFHSEIFKQNKNIFGMKQSQSRTSTNLGTQLNHAIYKDYESSIIDRALWEEAYTRNLTREQYLDLLNEVYAEDKEYKNKLLKIINDYGL